MTPGFKHYLRTVCSWCGKTMAVQLADKDKTTHGICPACAKKEMAKMDKQQNTKKA